MMSTVQLQALLDRFPTHDLSYILRMMHDIPPAKTVDRAFCILGTAKDRRVLNLGCASGYLHRGLGEVAQAVFGVDREPCPEDKPGSWLVCDLDETPERLRSLAGEKIELIVCGEILEHLGNPGNLLRILREFNCQLLVTVPNAFNTVAYDRVKAGLENVNNGHVAYYSYWTLRWLLERYRFKVSAHYWYHGNPRVSEGLIVLAQ